LFIFTFSNNCINEYLSSDELTIEYDAKSLQIKKEIYQDNLFKAEAEVKNNKTFQSLNENKHYFGNKCKIENPAKSISNKLVNLQKSKCQKHNYICNLCHLSYGTKSEFLNHFKCHSAKNNKLKNKIVIKPKRTNLNKNVYYCEICFIQFSDYSNCRRHIKNHYFTLMNKSNENYKCRFCMKVFTRLYNLQVHERKHTGERPYKCNVCHLAFSRNDNLKEHKNIHGDIQPLIYCNECNMSFFNKKNLTRHKSRIHYNKNVYICNECSKPFSRKDALIVHLRSQHTS